MEEDNLPQNIRKVYLIEPGVEEVKAILLFDEETKRLMTIDEYKEKNCR